MIDYLKGVLTELTPTTAVIECYGIGYDVNITLIDQESLFTHQGNNVKLFVYEVIREDSHSLYGFIERESRALFCKLIGVSGVGPNTARLILSAISLEQLKSGIATGDVSLLKNVKGIGAKTAQRIIVDLKDKIGEVQSSELGLSSSTSHVYDDAVAALVMLGFSAQQSGKALKKLFAKEPNLSTEEAIRKALQML